MESKISSQKLTHGLLYSRLTANLGLVVYIAAIFAFYYLYESIVPPKVMQIWLTVSIIIICAIVLQNTLIILRNPSIDELTQFWRPIDKVVGILLDLIVVGVIFALFPYADENAKLVTIVILVGYIPMAIVSDPENAAIIRFSIVLVLGSLAFAIFQSGGNANYVLAALVFLYGAVMFASVGTIRKTVLLAVERRKESEEAKAALEIALKEIGKERDSKTRFMAAASHDLAQPLQAANLFFEQAIATQNPILRTRAIEGARGAFASAQDLVSHMLTHLRLEADKVEFIIAPIDTSEFTQNITTQFMPSALAAGIEIRFCATKSQIYSDNSLLRRAIGNLITNSISHSGGSKILVCARKIGNSQIVFEVIDNGIGIAENESRTIFEDYFQSQAAQKPASGGFGLGLSSVKRIAEVLGGHVVLDKTWKNGARFRLALPMKNASEVRR